MPGESFDAASEPNYGDGHNKPRRPKQRDDQRRFIGVQFDCCRTYSRIYINPLRTEFIGHCPRCGKQICIKVSPDGTDASFFTAR